MKTMRTTETINHAQNTLIADDSLSRRLQNITVFHGKSFLKIHFLSGLSRTEKYAK